MDTVNDTLHVRIQYFTGQEEGDADVGHPYYVAACDEIIALTEAPTWRELLHNIQEMIAAHLDGEDTVALYNLAPKPRVVIEMELPENYAEIA
jgi:hypothetical protein